MTLLSFPEQYSTELRSIIEEQKLSALFQPIAALSDGQAFGFEGLIRGPSAHFLHSPINLFQTAERFGLVSELDIACRKVVIREFARSGLPGKLFLNVCPTSLTLPSFRPGATLEFLKKVGLAPQRVVIELTETQAITDYALLSNAIKHYRDMGFKIALDDLGEGFSSLRLWSELKPDFVKIDKYFIQGINIDPQKRQFVRSIQHIALNTSTRVVAEGIETVAELETIQRIGINLAQGYLIARPQIRPSAQLQLPRRDIERPIVINKLSTTAGSLLKETPTVSAQDSNEAVWQRFHSQADLYAMPVLENGHPIGLIKRNEILELFSRPFSRELFGARSCSTQMDQQPLVVEQATSLTELARQVTSSERRYLTDGFILTDQGRYLGMGTGQDLIRAMTELQLSAARHANPLTGLPGNVPIQAAITNLLQEQINFIVVYADLDYFKPYNDVYGYARGDELLQFIGQLLQQHFDPGIDFVGHVGGDDFILLLRSADWHARCEQLLNEFAERIGSYFTEEDRALGGYLAPNRQGAVQHHPLVSLSLGAAHIVASQYATHHEVASIASSAKSMAKSEQGNALFVERRLQSRADPHKYPTAVYQ